MAGTAFEQALIKNGVDGTSVEGAANLPYDIPNLTVELHTTQVGVPVHSWRSVGSTHTAYSTETFLDELAHAAGRDPLEVRRALLAKHPRHLAALNLAAEKAGWGQALPAGRARGIAVHESFNSVVAQVAEVSRRPDGLPRVERVVCADEHRTLRAPSAFASIADPTARAMALFVEAGKVLRHPRCLSCHPDGDRPSQGTGYPHQPPVQRGAEGHGVASMRCATCHQK